MDRRRSLLWLLLHVLGQILLFGNEASSSPSDKTIHISYLLQQKYFAGAINVAIERAQNDGLLPDYNFRYNFYCRYDRCSDLTVCFNAYCCS